jgi:hypothetical protein
MNLKKTKRKDVFYLKILDFPVHDQLPMLLLAYDEAAYHSGSM